MLMPGETRANISVKFKLDPGAEANVLPLRMFKSMKRKARHERRAHTTMAYKNSAGGIWRDENKTRRDTHAQVLHTQGSGKSTILYIYIY